MPERLRTKEKQTFESLIEYSGASGALWIEIEDFLRQNYDLNKIVHDSAAEGWGVNYKHGKKYICDIHAEKGAFVVFFQIQSAEIDKLEGELSQYALQVWERRYPCGKGGWMRYRVTKKEHLEDIYKLLTAKVKPKK